MRRTVPLVPLDEVADTIRAAIRVHIRNAQHPGRDVLLGCETCTALLAVHYNLTKWAMSSEGDGTGDGEEIPDRWDTATLSLGLD
jgi:hypothetical protein